MTEPTKLPYVLTLWYKPRQTMQGLIENGAGHRLALVVAIFFGIVQAGRFDIANGEGSIGYYAVGSLAGLLGLYLFGWLLRNFGRWFGGQATLHEVRVALGLGLAPWLFLFLALIVALGVGVEPSLNSYWIFFVGFLYGYVILLLSLATALRLSVLKTFLCLIVTFLVSLFPLTLLIQILASVVH
jgi:hypothetical protein